MKYTEYFLYAMKKPGRSGIKEDWIQSALDRPVRTEVQSDGRVRKWVWIADQAKYLRVVLLADGETVHNAFSDRGFKGDNKHEN